MQKSIARFRDLRGRDLGQHAITQLLLPPRELLPLVARVEWLLRQDVALVALEQLGQGVALRFARREVAALAHLGCRRLSPVLGVGLASEARNLLRKTFESYPCPMGNFAAGQNASVDAGHGESLR